MLGLAVPLGSRTQQQQTCQPLVVVHVFCGRARPGDLLHRVAAHAAERGLRVLLLGVDLASDAAWDLGEHGTLHLLLAAAAEGLIDFLGGGPPCSTVSSVRHNLIPGGPRPLRGRVKYFWGFPWLTAAEKRRVALANHLWVGMLALCDRIVALGGGFFFEHPEDPGCEPYPRFWAVPDMTEFLDRVRAAIAIFDQCPLGARTRKGSCIAGVLDGLEELHGLRCSGTCLHDPSWGRDSDGSFNSTRTQEYPDRLNDFLALRIVDFLCRLLSEGSGPGGWKRHSALPRITNWSVPASAAGPGVAVLNESTVRGSRVILNDDLLGFYLHVDDGIVLASGFAASGDVATEGMQSMAAILEEAGLVVPDQTAAADVHKIVGYAPRMRPARLELPGPKAVLLRGALDHLADLACVDTTVLRALVSLWVWAALLRREALSVPQAVFSMLDRHPDSLMRWWPSSRAEVRAMAALVPWLFADPGAPLCCTVAATDAMGANDLDHGGWGIACRDAPLPLVEAAFRQGTAVGRTVVKLDGDFAGLKHPDRTVSPNTPFTLLPDALFEEEEWKEVARGRWDYADHITLGEGRTVILLLDIITRSPAFHRLKLLSLEDNQPVAGLMSKGRSPAPALNFLCRRRAARTLAANIRLLLPWVESRRMPADELSRLLQ